MRYRGYYYDSETELYYLQSRYYDPTTSRFINADSYLSTGQDFLGFNSFAYCSNSPVASIDATGEASLFIWDYYWIHRYVQEECAAFLTTLLHSTVSTEQPLTDQIVSLATRYKAKGRLDIYIPSVNLFYEVKSCAVIEVLARAQMARYESLYVAGGIHPKHATFPLLSGEFRYLSSSGDWYLISYYSSLTTPGLIQYSATPIPDGNRCEVKAYSYARKKIKVVSSSSAVAVPFDWVTAAGVTACAVVAAGFYGLIKKATAGCATVQAV